MGTRIVVALMVLALVVPYADAREKPAPLDVVPSVDLDRYAGVWYEVARLPNRFEEKCVGDVTAEYSLKDDGGLKVVNRCRKKDGKVTEANGEARRADEDGPNSRLEVRFAPSFLSFLPFAWGDYQIMELAPDYTYAVVGAPDRKYLWVLARTPRLDEATYLRLLEAARSQGFDVSRMIRTRHG